jgi:hypothetical protein
LLQRCSPRPLAPSPCQPPQRQLSHKTASKPASWRALLLARCPTRACHTTDCQHWPWPSQCSHLQSCCAQACRTSCSTSCRPASSPLVAQGTRPPGYPCMYTQPAAQAAPATEQHMQAGAAARPGPDSLQPCSLRHHGSPHTAAGLLRPGSSSAHGPCPAHACVPGHDVLCTWASLSTEAAVLDGCQWSRDWAAQPASLPAHLAACPKACAHHRGYLWHTQQLPHEDMACTADHCPHCAAACKDSLAPVSDTRAH